MALGNWISGASKWIETVEKATDAVISSLGVTPVTSVFAPVALGLSAVLKGDRIGAENFSEVLEITQKNAGLSPCINETDNGKLARVLGRLRHNSRPLRGCPGLLPDRLATYASWPGVAATTPTPCCSVMT